MYLKINIIKDHDDFMIIDKPEDMDFHGEGGVLDSLRAQCSFEVYGVHRLDKATSGVMIFAKSKEFQKIISKKFAEHDVSKTYIALSDKRPIKKQGRISGDMDKGRGGSYRLLRSKKNPSITDFTCEFIESMALRLFIMQPKTGRTHQLRVALKSIASPILGDERYGGTASGRIYLHSWRMEFTYKGEKHLFESLPSQASENLFGRAEIGQCLCNN